MVRPLLARYWFSGRRERVVCWCLENCRFPRVDLPGATLAHFSCHISPCNTSLFLTSYVSFFQNWNIGFLFCYFVQVGRNCNLGRVSQSCSIAGTHSLSIGHKGQKSLGLLESRFCNVFHKQRLQSDLSYASSQSLGGLQTGELQHLKACWKWNFLFRNHNCPGSPQQHEQGRGGW